MVAKSVPSALKLKVCKALVRDPGAPNARRQCGQEYLGDRCPKKDETHVLTLKTGFCSNGWCEGSKATDWRGRPVPTCTFVTTCPCECHDQLDKLFHLTGAERVVVESSGYTHPPREFWVPSLDDVEPLSNSDDTTGPEIIESPAPDIVPATIAHNFRPTDTGRAARGELEYWVKHHCDIWLIDQPGEPCTPKYLASEISADQGIAPPSVGAIGAVFDRWTKLGFAVCLKQPVRFESYTEQGVKLGLDRMKEQAKKQARKERKQRFAR